MKTIKNVTLIIAILGLSIPTAMAKGQGRGQQQRGPRVDQEQNEKGGKQVRERKQGKNGECKKADCKNGCVCDGKGKGKGAGKGNGQGAGKGDGNGKGNGQGAGKGDGNGKGNGQGAGKGKGKGKGQGGGKGKGNGRGRGQGGGGRGR